MRALLAEQADFELVTDSDTFILTYRYLPQRLRQQMTRLLADGRLEQAAALNQQLNALNSELQTRQKELGHSFVSRTVLESTAYPGQTTVLRVVLTNMTTSEQHLREILAEQADIGAGLLEQMGL
jgi:glutamate/tyrosine decarboxylase-like PLP-dependent enzyme